MHRIFSLDDTRIGTGLADHPRTTKVISAILVGVVLLDFVIVKFYWNESWRCSLAIVAFLTAAIASAEFGSADSFGLRLVPRQGWRYWVKAAFAMALVVGTILVVTGAIVFLMLRYEPPPPFSAIFAEPHGIIGHLVRMCVVAPLQEEAIYRLAFCSAAIVWIGPKWCVVASGLLFASLHSIYGNPSPENLVGGFILAWAYLKSGSILVPLALHAGGNLIAFAAQWVHAAWFANVS